MSDLRAMLGDRYDETLDHAATAIAAATQYSRLRDWTEVAEDVLDAILPDLLAQAWDEGRQLGLKQADYEFGVAFSMPDLTNPYRQENDRG